MFIQSRLAQSNFAGHGVAVLATAAMLLARYAINGLIGEGLPLMAGLLAVILAAWYGGAWPGLLAMVLSALASVALFHDGGWRNLDTGDGLLLFGFLCIATVTSLLFGALRSAHTRIGAKRDEIQRVRGDHERSEGRAQDAELRHQLVMEASFDAIYEWAVEANQMVWNEGLSALFGYSDRVVEGARVWRSEHIHPADRDSTVESFQAAEHARSPKWSCEYRMLCADGRHVWVLDRAGLVFDARGRLTRVVGAMQDISKRQSAAEALAHFKALFEAQPSSILVCEAGPEFRIATASDAYLRATHTQRADIVGRPLFEAFPDDSEAQGIGPIRAAFEKVLATGRPEQLPVLPYAVPSDTGELEKRWWSTYHFPVYGPRGEITFVVQRADDVTEYVRTHVESGTDLSVQPYSEVAVQEARNLEHARQLTDANRRLGRVNANLAFFAEVAEATRPLLDPNAIVAAVADKLGRHLGVNRCAWVEFSDDGEHFEVLGDYTDGVASIRSRHALADFAPPEPLPADSTYVVNDVESEPDAQAFRAAYRSIAARATISVVLCKDGRKVAALAVNQSLPRDWTREEIELVQQVAERCRDSLERARALRAVSASEGRLRGLLDAMPAKVGTLTTDGCVDYLHRSWMEYSGLRLEEISGADNWARLFHPEDLPQYRELRRAALETGKAFAHEVRVLRKGGQYHWHLVQVSPVHDAAGHVQSWVSVAIDVHPLKQAEEALRTSNAYLRFLAQLSETVHSLSAPEVIAQTMCDAIGARLGVSRCTYTVVEPDEEHYDEIAEYVHGVKSRSGRRHFRVFGEGWWRHLQSLQSLVIDDVQQASYLVDVTACRSADIAAVLFVPLHRERRLVAIFALQHKTPRAWTEVEIEAADLAGNLCFESIQRAASAAKEEASRARLRETLDRLPDKVFTMTPQGVVDYISAHTLDYLPRRPQTQAATWLEFVHPEDRARGSALLACLLAGKQPADEELRFERRDGTFRWHLVRFAPLHNAEGQLDTWIGAWSDQHDLKQVELRLRETDRAKDEFLATLAHELRNPIAPIANGLELLVRAGDDNSLRERMLGLMSRQLSQMVRLVDDLLDVSRITTGKLVLRREDAALADVVRNAVESVDPLILAGRHHLEIVLPREPVILYCDAARLAQVLSNLLTNSVKYSDKPGTIRLSAVREDDEICIEVQDHGIGIPPEVLPQVFDMFAQSDRALSRAQGGLGIGLSLVRRLVELHGGRVEGASAGAGCGSTFTVHLPLHAPDRPPMVTAVSTGDSDLNPKTLAARKILVADDNIDSAESLAALLRMWGHEVHIAHDGDDALRRAADVHPEVMVLDLGMPRRDGVETAREVRAQAWGHDITLIALSGWGQPADRDKTRAAGFDHHLVKPVDVAKLEKLLTLG